MAITSAQRGQTLHALDTKHMELHKSSVIFRIKDVLKQSRPGKGLPTVKFLAYAPDRRLCVVRYIYAYLKRTNSLREDSQLLISYKAPHKKVGRNTIARWIKTIMQMAGIDTDTFKAHSTRAASTSAAKQAQVPLEHILQVAGWTGCATFAQYYDKPIQGKKDFGAAVLQC